MEEELNEPLVIPGFGDINNDYNAFYTWYKTLTPAQQRRSYRNAKFKQRLEREIEEKMQNADS